MEPGKIKENGPSLDRETDEETELAAEESLNSEPPTPLTLKSSGAMGSGVTANNSLPSVRLDRSLEPLDLVWAKCRGSPWYPALVRT